MVLPLLLVAILPDQGLAQGAAHWEATLPRGPNAVGLDTLLLRDSTRPFTYPAIDSGRLGHRPLRLMIWHPAVPDDRSELSFGRYAEQVGLLLGRDYFVAGRYDEVIEQYRRAIEIDSTSPLALGIGQEGSFGLGDVYARQGRNDEAIAEYLRTTRLEGIPAGDLERFREGYAESGLKGVWRRRLEYELRDAGTNAEALRIASLLARVGDADQTAEWIERAYQDRAMALPFLAVLPTYDSVRSHPRFRAVLERMRLTDALERRGAAVP